MKIRLVLGWCGTIALAGCSDSDVAGLGESMGGSRAQGGASGSAGGSSKAGSAGIGTGGASAGSGHDAAGSASGGQRSGIALDGRELYLDGKPFRIRGVNWNPVAKGETHPNGLDFAGSVARDAALMKAAGINAVRTYERLENTAVLDELHAAGIYVFSTVYGWWEDDPNVVTARVNAVKHHPAILAWVIGNEWNYNRLYSQGSSQPALSIEETRARLNAAAAAIKAADPAHPVSTVYGELDGLAESMQAMPDVDIWGINAYRGISFGDLFTRYARLGNKPLYLGEYGADAYDSRGAGKLDLASQSEATTKLTRELIDHYVAPGVETGVTLGGFIFEWSDEWWKAGAPATQDIGGVAPGGGPYPDSTFNEEYWGVVDIERSPRPAYEALKALYRE